MSTARNSEDYKNNNNPSAYDLPLRIENSKNWKNRL